MAITDATAQLSWSSGPDNHSPITMYMVQARTPFSIGWQTVKTGKSLCIKNINISGGAQLIELIASAVIY